MTDLTGLPADLTGLADEFPRFEFATQYTSGGISIVARRKEDCAGPGLYAIVTGDQDELRQVILEDEQSRYRG